MYSLFFSDDWWPSTSVQKPSDTCPSMTIERVLETVRASNCHSKVYCDLSSWWFMMLYLHEFYLKDSEPRHVGSTAGEGGCAGPSGSTVGDVGLSRFLPCGWLKAVWRRHLGRYWTDNIYDKIRCLWLWRPDGTCCNPDLIRCHSLWGLRFSLNSCFEIYLNNCVLYPSLMTLCICPEAIR